ncbi:dihydrofolate reductase family protein [Microbacterium sp. NPDC056234]|uniref:dihydrofolate reductase family protein n=1 Tax=Microbacterium sp. NPDC056234 TaxID=3345757 RepID=UPI0035D5C416
MSKVMIHATVSVDGFMADPDGGMDWMNGFPVAAEDEHIVRKICSDIGAIVGGANKTQTIEEREIPYGGFLKVPVYLMTHSGQEAVERDGTRFTFVVDDIDEAVRRARQDAGEKWVSVLGGRVARQCLALGLIDEIRLHVVPAVLGEGIPLFAGLERQLRLERLETAAFASEVHLCYRVQRAAPASGE